MAQKQRQGNPCSGCRSGCSYIFQGLSPAAFSELAAAMRPMQLGAGETVFHEGMPAFGLYILCRGKVKVAKHTRGGRSQILKLLGPGEILGEKTLFDQETYTCYAKTLEPSRLMFIPREDFLSFVRRHPEVAIRLVEKLSRELKVFGDRLVEITSRSAKERVARVLLELARAFGEEREEGLDLGVELPRGELAEMAGVSTETAIRILSELKERGIVSLSGHRIVVNKLETLKGLAHPFRTFLRENLV
ncbi:Crp/Fnr family transcriptional regulator [Candidatus Bipolaricaulota bacterium]|nr:Crp/Fnr family transcriptional regulator [Candidatus Bipolaricaulota bacterium]